MADVTGPIHSLPGSSHGLPQAAMCDDHPDRPAVARVQGETDSMGSEMNDFCQECLDAHRRHEAEARIGACDWCKGHATDLSATRDWEEGRSGPVYMVCGGCLQEQSERIHREMADELEGTSPHYFNDEDLYDPNDDEVDPSEFDPELFED